jgi:hypothetical protein
LYLKRGLGTGEFAAFQRLAPGFGNVRMLAAVGDMTGDGWPDLMGQPKGGVMRIYPGKGVGGVRPSFVARAAVDAARQIPIGLWNPDGAPDVLYRKGGTLTVIRGNGPGGLTSAQRIGIDMRPFDWTIGVSDVGITGHADVIVRKKGTGQLWLLPGSAAGFRTPVLLGTGMGIYDKAT